MHAEKLYADNGNLGLLLSLSQHGRRYELNVPRLECGQCRGQRVRAATVPVKHFVAILFHKRIAGLLKRRPTSGQLNLLDNLLSLRAAINSRQDPTGWMEASEDVKDNQKRQATPNRVNDGVPPHLARDL
jgi:hypothetical protein